MVQCDTLEGDRGELFKYCWRVPFDVNLRTEGGDVESSFSVGDEVWVKPSPPLCAKQWMPGKVTRIVSKHTVCVDSKPRYVRDIRKPCTGVNRGSSGHLHADDLRGRYVVIEPGGVPFAILPCGDVGETGFLEQTNDQGAPVVPPGDSEVLEDKVLGTHLRVPLRRKLVRFSQEIVAEQNVEEQILLRRSQRVRRRPRYLDQYEY